MVIRCVLVALVLNLPAHAQPITTGFTYQGVLRDEGELVNNEVDCRFRLFDADTGGNQVVSVLQIPNVQVTNGVFTVDEIDFGVDAFDGGQRWLQVEIRNPAGPGFFVPLIPRQAIRPTPYASQLRGVFVDATHNLGLGGTLTPAARLHVAGPTPDLLVQDAGYGLYVQADDALTLQVLDVTGSRSAYFFHSPATDGGQFVLDDAGVQIVAMGADNFSGSGAFVMRDRQFLTTTVELLADHDLDNANGSSQGVLMLRSTGDGSGGLIDIRNDDDDSTILAMGGAAGQGGRIDLLDGAGFPGITLHASENQEPAFRLTGSARAVAIELSSTGDSSVTLPVDAISNTEILDEPGIANTRGTASIPDDASITDLLVRTITVPAPGYIVVMGGGELTMNHSGGITSAVAIGVSDVGGAFPNPDQHAETSVPDVAPGGSYRTVVAVHGVFDVVGGAHTFHLVAQNTSGDPGAALNDARLTLMYFPTAYGTTVSDLVPAGGPLLTASTERPVSIADELRRRDEELRRMIDEVAQLRQRLERLETAPPGRKVPVLGE